MDELAFRLATNFRESLREFRRRLDFASTRVRHFDFRRSLAITRTKLDAGNEALLRTMKARLAHDRASLEQLSGRLNALSPVKILERGYALVFDSNGQLVKDAAQLAPGDQISARVCRGTLTAEVKRTNTD